MRPLVVKQVFFVATPDNNLWRTIYATAEQARRAIMRRVRKAEREDYRILTAAVRL